MNRSVSFLSSLLCSHFLLPVQPSYPSIFHYRIKTDLSIYLSMALQPFVGPWPLYLFPYLYTISRTPWTGDQSVARPLPAHRTAQTQNKRTQISIS
jgi:hypothetical protein